MKFKSKIFFDEDKATKVALYLRAKSSERQALFKTLSSEEKRMAEIIKTERKKRKQPIWGY